MKTLPGLFMCLFMVLYTGLCLVGCTGLANTVPTATQTQQIETACATASTTLQALVVVKSKLSAADIAAVNNAASVITPVCTSATTPTYSTTAYAALSLALSQLTALQTKYAPSSGSTP